MCTYTDTQTKRAPAEPLRPLAPSSSMTRTCFRSAKWGCREDEFTLPVGGRPRPQSQPLLMRSQRAGSCIPRHHSWSEDTVFTAPPRWPGAGKKLCPGKGVGVASWAWEGVCFHRRVCEQEGVCERGLAPVPPCL